MNFCFFAFFLLVASCYERLLISSDNITDITIISHSEAVTQRTSQYNYENDTNKFPFSKPAFIWGPSFGSVPNWESRTFQHLFSLNCSAQLNLYVIADDLFTAYLNGVKVLFTPYNSINKGDNWFLMVFKKTITYRSSIYFTNQVNNLTIVGVNYRSHSPTPASIGYQLTQSSTENCDRLIAQSGIFPQITIINSDTENVVQSTDQHSNDEFIIPGSEPLTISGTTQSFPNKQSLVFQHLLTLNCNAPIKIQVIADDMSRVFLNGVQIFQSSCFDQNDDVSQFCLIRTENITISPDQNILIPCGTNNLTINVTNYCPTCGLNWMKVSYQVSQVDEDECIQEECSAPLTWKGVPACSCQCTYSQMCGPGFLWKGGKRSSYKYSHLNT